MNSHPDSLLQVGKVLDRPQPAYSEHEASLEGTTKAAMTYESSSDEFENLSAQSNALIIKKRDKKAGSRSEARLKKLEQPD